MQRRRMIRRIAGFEEPELKDLDKELEILQRLALGIVQLFVFGLALLLLAYVAYAPPQ